MSICPEMRNFSFLISGLFLLYISAKMNNNLYNDMILHFNEQILIKKQMIVNVNSQNN